MVEWYKIISSEVTPKHTVHRVMVGGREETILYASVRAGVSFPGEECPGALIVIAQETDDKFESSSPRLFLLDELEFGGLSVDRFWDAVTDALVLHHAAPLYLDIKDEVNLAALQDFCSRRDLNIDWQEAPFADNFFTGLATANDWLAQGRLELDKASRVRAQLKDVRQEDLRDKPAQRFPLVNAMRHVLSGFRKFPPAKPLELGRSMKHYGKGGWMA